MLAPMPRRGELMTIAISAIVLRIAVFVAAMLAGHFTLDQYTAKGDTASYIANAAVMTGERTFASLSEYDHRVFPGYPALIGMVHRLGIPLSMSALIVTWLSAGIAAAVAGKVFSDARVGWAMVCLIPHYLINSSLGMSEAPLLAFVCLGLLASQRDQQLVAGALFGIAGIIRPMACFALLGLLITLVRENRIRRAVLVVVAAIAVFSVEMLMVKLWTGDALQAVRVYAQHPDAYAGHLFAWPFQSLLSTPRHDSASIGRIAYIWLHVVITLVACGLIAEQVIKVGRSNSRDVMSCVWFIGNTAFVLCIGSVWGFRHFPRFTIPAAPAMFWTLRRVLPRKASWWGGIMVLCGVAAVFGVIDSK